ncbi:TPA: hypothetical protein ACH3X2_001448 [Trebouxia sp. C0005]
MHPSEDRRGSPGVQSPRRHLSFSSTMPNTFSFVYIPAAVSEPIEQWEESYKPDHEESEIKALTDRCKRHFSKVRGPRTPEQKAARRAALMQNVPGNSDVDEAMLDTATAMSMVNGDAFIGRTFDNGDDFKRLDFTVSEVSSSAAWVQEARKQNEQKRQRDSPAALQARLADPQAAKPAAVTVREVPPAEALKEQGNTALKQGKLPEAVRLYSEALETDSTLAAAYNNRALAHLKLNNLADAEADCGYVLRLEPRNVKAFLRRGSAREAMNRLQEAIEDYKEAVVLEPKSKEALSMLSSARQKLADFTKDVQDC